MLFNLKKEGNPGTCDNMGDPGGHSLYKTILSQKVHLYQVPKIIKLIEP